MDVLYVVKEEYAAVRQSMPAILSDEDATLVSDPLRSLLTHVSLLVRIADELILPELADTVTKGISALADAGTQSQELGRIVQVSIKSGRMGESKRKAFLTCLSSHIRHMEQIILPMFRDEIPTRVREELGIVALDFKGELRVRGLEEQTWLVSSSQAVGV